MLEIVGEGFNSFLDSGDIDSQQVKIDYIHFENSIFGFENQEHTERPQFIYNGGKLVQLELSNIKDSQKWTSSKFEAYHQSPNRQEYNCKATYFSDESAIYSLITKQSGASHIQNIYRWNSKKNRFESLELDAPEPIEEKEYAIIEVIIVDGTTEDRKKMVILSNNGKYFIHKMNIDQEKVRIKRVGAIENRDEYSLANERALRAAVIGENVYITFGVEGCGLMWIQNKLLIFNIENQKTEEIEVSGDSPYFSIRPYTSWIGSDQNSWIFCCGSGRAGRGQSKFNGDTWVIENLNSECASWRKLKLTVPDEYEGTVIKDKSSDGVFSIGRSHTIRAIIE